jgi:hypothetical protein
MMRSSKESSATSHSTSHESLQKLVQERQELHKDLVLINDQIKEIEGELRKKN